MADIARRMRLEWNERARTNPHWYFASDASNEEEFRRSGEHDTNVALRGLDDKWLEKASAIEIGCGAARMTSFLALRVGRLVATDVSSEMIALARERLAIGAHVALVATNGEDLNDFATDDFDLAISYVVFQHIPKRVVNGLVEEIRRVLRPGGIFRGQFACITDVAYVAPSDEDTFTMRSWTADEVRSIFDEWPDVQLETVPVTPTTHHIWVTAQA
jgi:ubiquinone/menaquinone biosynthesis C-methylase UbiE